MVKVSELVHNVVSLWGRTYRMVAARRWGRHHRNTSRRAAVLDVGDRVEGKECVFDLAT